MAYFETNNDFFGYNGVINRKNYAINMAIMFLIFLGLYFINFATFLQHTSVKFLFYILDFVISLVKFVAVFAMLSLIYRRFMDISKSKSLLFSENIKKLFIILFVFPVLYCLCVRLFIYNIPFIINILDILTFFVLIPVAAVIAIIISFIK